jgi:threonine dehydrogenase-like Zn-dependent dehydrogenase
MNIVASGRGLHSMHTRMSPPIYPRWLSVDRTFQWRRAMQALTYQGARDVRVETVPDPALVESDDLILRVTATAICGSDLHIFHGKIPDMRDGDILGHEFMGIVEEVGREVTAVKPGDRVVIPFVIACGHCFHCALNEFAACETTNPGHGAALNRKQLRPPAALFGYSHLYGGVPGGQAELVRVPKANVGPFAVPDVLSDEQVLFLSDILPTGYQAVINADVKPGSTLAIFGAGPVGCMAAACACMLGASVIYMIDHHDYRLEYAQNTYGVIPINFDEQDDPAAQIIEATAGRGVDAAIDAVGFEAKGSTTETVLTTLKLEGSSGAALRQCIAATRRGGIVSVPGVYAGFIHGFLFGDAFDKGLTFKMGQTHVQALLPELLEAIGEGRLRPEEIITHRMKLADAAQGYDIFNERKEACRKVVLTP